ncbi:hypothetical protein HPQ64_12935 [Rhizobiales bacterium]|uniref:hypothetical protein n=1 Tax=Hongsoonwoonella zoysiae TaxID=2821844 RepID=UPI00155FF5EE|nr:hypothetical protein [Hongsoonwoonella zoysiae]NRG18595.1 hypothetical protein [Hongsoonwoonella zoysiae]
MYRIWDSLQGVDASHEPKPNFHKVMRSAQKNPKWARDFLRWEKFPAMLRSHAKAYVETSHLFCKAFIEPALEFGLRPSFITLRRDPRAIAISHLMLRTIPGRTWGGQAFCLSPQDSVFLSVEDWEGLTDYQLCYWYALEIQKRQAVYEKILPQKGLQNFSITTRELNDIDRVTEMVETLAGDAITPDTKRLSTVVGQLYNHRRGSGARTPDIDFDREESELERRLAATEKTLVL